MEVRREVLLVSYLIQIVVVVASHRRVDNGVSLGPLTVYTSRHFTDNELCKTLACNTRDLCVVDGGKVATCKARRTLKHGTEEERKLIKMVRKQDRGGRDEETHEDEEEHHARCPQCSVKEDYLSKPVCGSDGVTYKSRCQMERSSCERHISSLTIECYRTCPCAVHNDDIIIEENKEESNSDESDVDEFDLDDEWFGHNIIRTPSIDIDDDDDDDDDIDAGEDHDKERRRKERQHQFLKKLSNTGRDEMNTANSDKPKHNHHHHRSNGWQHHHEKGENDVIKPSTAAVCDTEDMEAVGDRLLDSLYAIKLEEKRENEGSYRHRNEISIGSCKPVVEWMFSHLDTNRDRSLSRQEVDDIDETEYEECSKKYLKRCDVDSDDVITAYEFCKCFSKTETPCLRARSRVPTSHINGQLQYAPGTFIPTCNSDGYYSKIQCHSSIGYCWCADKHGNEYGGSRVRGKPLCDDLTDDSDEDEGSADYGN